MNRMLRAIAAFATLGTLAPATTLAGYYVETDTSTQGIFNVGSSASYYGVGYGNVNPPYANFYATPNYGTASGTTDTTGLVTSSFDRATIISPDNPGNGLATSSSDLSTATTHVSAQSTNNGQAVSGAQLGDTIHFAVAGANASTSTTIGFQYVVQGTYLDSDPANADTYLKAYMTIYGPGSNFNDTINLYVQANYNTNGIPTIVTALDGFPGSGFASMTPTSFVVNGTFTILGNDPSIQFSTYLNAHQQSGAADLDYTSSFKFTSLPSNVTYTSDSGVFLSPSAVPEPSSLALVLLGGGVTALAARRKHRRS